MNNDPREPEDEVPEYTGTPFDDGSTFDDGTGFE